MLIDRVDLTDTGIRVSLNLPNVSKEADYGDSITPLIVARVFPMQIKRRGFEMRLCYQGQSRAGSDGRSHTARRVAVSQ